MRQAWVVIVLAVVGGCSVNKLKYVMASKPGASVSDLVDKDPHDLTLVAVRELMGEGNAIREVQPDPREAPTLEPAPKWGWVDQRFLAEEVFAPYVDASAKHRDDKKRRGVLLAWCEWLIASGAVEWAKAPGQAIDQGACPGRLAAATVFEEPGAKYALAQTLLQGHPRAPQLLDEVRAHLIDTIGGKPERICFDDNGHDPAKLKVNDGCYADLWQAPSRHDDHINVRAYVFKPHPLEARTPRQLAETAAVALTLSTASPRSREVPELLAKISSLQTWKAAEKFWPVSENDAYLGQASLEKAIVILQKLPKGGHLYDAGQARIALGQAKIAKLKDDAAKAAKEAKLAAAKAAAEERRYLASLGPGQRRVYDELGPPHTEEPAPGGGRVWRYEDPVYSNLADRYGTRIIIGYKFREFVFDAGGGLRARKSGAN